MRLANGLTIVKEKELANIYTMGFQRGFEAALELELQAVAKNPLWKRGNISNSLISKYKKIKLYVKDWEQNEGANITPGDIRSFYNDDEWAFRRWELCEEQ